MLAKRTKSLADQVKLQNDQTKSLADQVRLQNEQTNELAKQTQLQAEQYVIVAASTELQFNLNVMIRLQEILSIIAENENSRNEIWGDLEDGRKEALDGDALLDVIEMALKACERLPNFAPNEEDWSSYTEYVMADLFTQPTSPNQTTPLHHVTSPDYLPSPRVRYAAGGRRSNCKRSGTRREEAPGCAPGASRRVCAGS
jgi:hypothetical protein